jgi:hypothetical protein
MVPVRHATIILSILGCAHAVSVALLPATVPRINWGVVFRKGPTILNGVSNHKHTFSIPVPQLLYEPIGKMDCSNIKAKTLNCDAINDLVTYINNETLPLIEDYRRRVNTWLMALPNVDVTPGGHGEPRTKRDVSTQNGCEQ